MISFHRMTDVISIDSLLQSEIMLIFALNKTKKIKKCRLLVHQHAEILLVDHLSKSNISPSNRSEEVEIGISKLPCLLCSFYINELNKKISSMFLFIRSNKWKSWWKMVFKRGWRFIDHSYRRRKIYRNT